MTTLCFIDTETTGLDARVHQPYEVCVWREDRVGPETFNLPHTLEYADPRALAIGGYWRRGFTPHIYVEQRNTHWFKLTSLLRDVTLVGSNPAFDAAMMRQFLGCEVWHHRLVNVAEGAMWVFNWDRPKGLADVAARCRAEGYKIPEPDHTAEGDVRTTRAVYEALRAFRGAS